MKSENHRAVSGTTHFTERNFDGSLATMAVSGGNVDGFLPSLRAEAFEGQPLVGFSSNRNGSSSSAKFDTEKAESMDLSSSISHGSSSISPIGTCSAKTLDGILPEPSNLDGSLPISVIAPQSVETAFGSSVSAHEEVVEAEQVTIDFDQVSSPSDRSGSSSSTSMDGPDSINQPPTETPQQEDNENEITRCDSPIKIGFNDGPLSSKTLKEISEEDDEDEGVNLEEEEERLPYQLHDPNYNNCSRRYHKKVFNEGPPTFYDHNCCPGVSVSVPVEEAGPTGVGAGLRNLGNTCFINAILQCFTHTVPLIEALCSCKHVSPCGSDEFCVLCALRDHIELSLASSGKIISPLKLVDNLNNISSCFQRYQQEDAHEFLQCLLDCIERCCLNTYATVESSSQVNNIVERVFGGRLVSKLRCCNCGHFSEKYEPLIDLSLEIENVDTLQQALDSFTKLEKIEDPENKVTCENCKEEVFREKQLMLDQSPSVAALHLKRFKTDGSFVQKIGKHVEFPLELDLKPYINSCADTCVDLKYQLYAIVVHNGFSPTSGHYFSYIRSCPETWHKLDDSMVDKYEEEIVLSQAAYILFYVRENTPWFSSLIESQKLYSDSRISNRSPKSVLENVDSDCISYRSVLNISNCEASVMIDATEQTFEGIQNNDSGYGTEGNGARMSCGSSQGEGNLWFDESRCDVPMVDVCLASEASDGHNKALREEKLSALHREENISNQGLDGTEILNVIRPSTPPRSLNPCTDSGGMPEGRYHIPRAHLKVENRVNSKRSPDKAGKDLERKEAFRYLKKNMPFSRSMKLMAAMLPRNDKKRRLRLSPKKISPPSRRKFMHHVEVLR